MKIMIGVAVLSFALSVVSPAQDTTGRGLLENCQKGMNILDGNALDTNMLGLAQGSFCKGYLAAVLDLILLTEEKALADEKLQKAPGKISATGVCPPSSDITNEEIIRVVVKWLKENPDKLHDSGIKDVMRALRSAYPCK